MKTYEPSAGTRIQYACRQAVALAAETNETVRFTFNGIALQALPSDKPQILVDRWETILAERNAASSDQLQIH